MTIRHRISLLATFACSLIVFSSALIIYHYASIPLFIAVSSTGLMVFYMFIYQLHEEIVSPLKEICDKARAVTNKHDYSVRLNRGMEIDDKEISEAVRAFNQMMLELEDHDEELKHSREEGEQAHKVCNLITESNFEFSNLNEVRELAVLVSHFFPKPEDVQFGLTELMINAVEHGNLGIGYDKKTELIKQGIWRKEVEKRLEQPENKNKKARMQFRKQGNKLVITIEDQGKGFDSKPYMNISPERLKHTHGRGIATASAMSFDNVVFLNGGNTVQCAVEV